MNTLTNTNDATVNFDNFINKLAESYTEDFIEELESNFADMTEEKAKEIVSEFFNETMKWLREYVAERNLSELFQPILLIADESEKLLNKLSEISFEEPKTELLMEIIKEYSESINNKLNFDSIIKLMYSNEFNECCNDAVKWFMNYVGEESVFGRLCKPYLDAMNNFTPDENQVIVNEAVTILRDYKDRITSGELFQPIFGFSN
jgi:Glu-tRNA(Gln) amidotransferase subunit E-like FAD-binding protein